MKTAECNYGISQEDMYQMYAYAHRYSSGNYLRAELFKIIHGTSANQTSEVSKISEVYG